MGKKRLPATTTQKGVNSPCRTQLPDLKLRTMTSSSECSSRKTVQPYVSPTVFAAVGFSAAPVTRRKSSRSLNGMIWRRPASSTSRAGYESDNRVEELSAQLSSTSRWIPSERRDSSTRHRATAWRYPLLGQPASDLCSAFHMGGQELGGELLP